MDLNILKYFESLRNMGTCLNALILHSSTLRTPIFVETFGKDRGREMIKIRQSNCQTSWIWDQYLPENMSGILVI